MQSVAVVRREEIEKTKIGRIGAAQGRYRQAQKQRGRAGMITLA
jgi:hypothetical protein